MDLSVVPSKPCVGGSLVMIKCCLCGTPIETNAANQCGACLSKQFDLKSIIQTGPSHGPLQIHQCRQCRRYETSQYKYSHLEPESPELLSVLLKNIPALSSLPPNLKTSISKISLIDAMFVWTEPNCMRFKIRVTVRADISNPTNLQIQQRVLVEFIIRFQQCNACNREFRNRTWQALVQLRQKRSIKPLTGLYLVEMAIAKNETLKKKIMNVVTSKQGFDFYFLQLSEAQNFVNCLSKIVPLKCKTTRKLVSEDLRNNTANLKSTICCDMVPLCRDDLIIVDKKMGGKMAGKLCLVVKLSGSVRVVDGSPQRTRSKIGGATGPDGDTEGLVMELHPEKYWKGEKFVRIMLSSVQLVGFVVLDVEFCEKDHDDNDERLYKGPQSGVDKYALADVIVARESDFGVNDETFSCVTHLGNLLQAGDVVLGYDLAASVLATDGEEYSNYFLNSNVIMPDVVLVKKIRGVLGKEAPFEDEGDGLEEKRKARVKSSGSKKRERRMKKEEKKMKEMADMAKRMGLSKEEEEISIDGAVDFEKELEDDPELARELEEAERELSKISEEEEHDIIHDLSEDPEESEKVITIDENSNFGISEK